MGGDALGLVITWTESIFAWAKLRLELNLNTSLLEADDTLVRSKLTLRICDEALLRAKFALVTARFATVTLAKAEEVATLAFCITMAIVCDAEFCAALMPLEAEIDACWSCWLKVALRAMIVREISTVALSTRAVMRLEQSCGLF